MIRVTYLACSQKAKDDFVPWFKTCYENAIDSFVLAKPTDDNADTQYVFEAFVQEEAFDLNAVKRVVAGRPVDFLSYLPSSETELEQFRQDYGYRKLS